MVQRITRARSKTRRHEGVPTVTYSLWPRTATLLKQHREKSGRSVLRTINGEPLVRSWIKDSGEVAKVDSVRLAFVRALAAANRKDKKDKAKGTFKQLRATAANVIEQSDFSGAASLFLGHSPRALREKHYVDANQTQLDRAVEYLGKHLNIAD